MKLRWKKTDPRAFAPVRGSEDAAGLDLYTFEERTLRPGQKAVFQTGIAVAIPPGHVGLVCPRSGLASTYGLTVLNAPGVVDADYRGEVKVLLVNHGDKFVLVKAGWRIAQLVIVPVAPCEVVEVDSLDDTPRGLGGFGSTGLGVSEPAA